MGAKILLFLILELRLFVKLVVMQKQEVVGGDTSYSSREHRIPRATLASTFRIALAASLL